MMMIKKTKALRPRRVRRERALMDTSARWQNSEKPTAHSNTNKCSKAPIMVSMWVTLPPTEWRAGQVELMVCEYEDVLPHTRSGGSHTSPVSSGLCLKILESLSRERSHCESALDSSRRSLVLRS